MAAVSRPSIPDSLTLELDFSSSSSSPPSSSTQPHHHHQPHTTAATAASTQSQPQPSQDGQQLEDGDNSTSAPPPTQFLRHSSSPSLSSGRTPQRSPSGIFSFAAAAFDKTTVRPRHSLARLSFTPGHLPSSEPTSPARKSIFRIPSNQSLAHGPIAEGKTQTPAAGTDSQQLLSQPYSETDPNTPPPVKVSPRDSKMHQTSSRLLRMTDDERPFTKDFKDLFSTLIVSLLPLSSHRVRLSKVDYTFLSEDAINNLGSLKFSQSNRMPDPKDPSRIVTTTTTTTFSMAKDMARSICQRFLEARFIESADGKYQQVYNMKGSVWQLTPKGVTVLDRFCSKNGIQQKQVAELTALHSTQLVILERDLQTDKLMHDRSTIEVIFRRFAGAEGRNVKPSVNAADSESLHDYRDGLTGVKMAAERKINGKTYRETLTGKAASDWLMDCSTIVDRRETMEIATLFVEYDLMEPVAQDRNFMSQNAGSNMFQPTKYAIYQITQRGKDVIAGHNRGRQSESEGGGSSSRNAITRDSNTQRLDKILADPALRLLFRENLRETHCEENLSFYKDVDEFVRSCKAAIRLAQKNPSATSLDSVKEIMAQAYGIYNAFLAPGSPCELNIDHQLRNNLATRMTKAVGQDVAMVDTLQEVTSLFEDAQNAVFKLMASDSVPKFLRSPKYEQQLRNNEFDNLGRGPERSQSRSNRK
ncbi:Developmental regulator-like protein [Emericellopsis cladophorae]|uniref:Developmental regulator-like protein n=1 Tax=Emericellopsis cladophorae TaxID=2686198 RepID=A0A9P9Y920_9HYPO|nr:Developmental regulator-like protein [Emericellopsis cladophorae]KAI6785220.1 Developmental regulator-like protein [Emericellopsis cladophorae]